MKAIVETGQTQVAALPDEALVDYQGQKYIFVGEPGGSENTSDSLHHFRMVALQTGNSDVGFTEIILPEGVDKTRVVVKGAFALLSKMKNSEETEHGH